MSISIGKLVLFVGCFLQTGIFQRKPPKAAINTKTTKPGKMMCESSGGMGAHIRKCYNIELAVGNGTSKLSSNISLGDNWYFVDCELPNNSMKRTTNATGILDCSQAHEKKCLLTLQAINCTAHFKNVGNTGDTGIQSSTRTSPQSTQPEPTHKGTQVDTSLPSTKPTTQVQPTHTEHSGVRLSTLVIGVVAGFLGGVLITMVTVVVCWKCRKRSAAGTYVGLKAARPKCKNTSATSREIISRSKPDQVKMNGVLSIPTTEPVPSENMYVDINDEKLAVTFHPSTETSNKADQQDTYNTLGDHSEAKTGESKSYDRIGASENSNLSSDYFVLEDDSESQNTYNKLGDQSVSSRLEPDTYSRLDHAAKSSGGFVLKDDPETQNTFDKLKVQPGAPQKEPDTKNTDQSPYYFVLEDPLKGQNSTNNRRSPSDASRNTRDPRTKIRNGGANPAMPATDL